MLKLDKMLLVGSDQRKSGKTTLVCELIKKVSINHDLVAIKVTMLSENGPNSNHKNTADRDCCLRERGYCIVEDNESCGQNDTSRFLAAGARRSLWLQVFKKHLLEGFETVLKEIGKDAVIICESTSLRKIVEPGIFIMMVPGIKLSGRKKNAEHLRIYADVTWPFYKTKLENYISRITFTSDKWNLRRI